MAKLEMRRIEITALNSERKGIMERLQRRGVVEISENRDERLAQVKTSSAISVFERNLAAVNSALECLNRYTGHKESMLAGLNGRKPVSTQEFAEGVKRANNILSVCFTILDCSKKIAEAETAVSGAQTRIDVLKPWAELELPLDFKGTKTTRVYIGTLTGSHTAEEVESALAGTDDINAAVDIISMRKEQTCLCVTCHKTDADAVYTALRDMGFVQMTDGVGVCPKDEIQRLSEEISESRESAEKYSERIKDFDGMRADIEFLADYLTVRRDKYKELGKLGLTRETFVVEGYIPKRYAEGLKSEFESKYTAAISIQEPADDEDVPVVLKNGWFSEPVEGITEMYALPNKHDVDPSSVMAFFYYLFFGMMLSDAGYGLMMVIGTSIALKRFTVEGALRRSLTMFKYCGISTLIWGALFGSWFGDLPQVIASSFFGRTIETTALWFEPLDDPIKLLLFSFMLGIAHLFLGLAVNFRILWKEGRRLDAFCDTVPVYLTILGAAPAAASILTDIPAGYVTIGKYLAAAGIILIVLTSGRTNKNIFLRFFGGIYGLYNVATGYLSDILSYSRLLALGLATGSIAGVINLIGTMPENIVLKAVMLTVVGIVGHVANMGINLLGAYVHADRLQFVELFSKFYEGGGRPFKPLCAKTKYIKFKKENIYE